MNKYFALMDNGKVNFAAARLILKGNGESILLRTFDDALEITYRLKVAEKLIEAEEDSEEKKEIEEEIEWYKKFVREAINEKKKMYSSVMASSYAKVYELEEFTTRVIAAIEEETEDFYAWIHRIESIR